MAGRKKHFLITAGPTREYIDPVRFISNASSGKMGYALAQAAQQAGYRVTLISASQLQPPVGIDFVGVDTAAEMFDAVRRFFEECDCLIMAAAVADYTPVRCRKKKIKKTGQNLILKLKPTKDILLWAGQHKRQDQFVVGFALEDSNLLRNAQKKLVQKKLDMIIANGPESIAADETTVYVKCDDENWCKIGPASKFTIARRIIEIIGERFA